MAAPRLTLLSRGEAAPVGFENFLGNPADEGIGVRTGFELLSKLCLELIDV
jgi:hypothetical protein